MSFNLGSALEDHMKESIESATKRNVKNPGFLNLDSVVFESTDFCALDIPERQALLAPWLKEQSITLLTGWRGTGKTWFGMAICNAITTGQPFGPWKVGTPYPCLYLEGEMTASDVKSRLMNLSDTERKAPLYIYSEHTLTARGCLGQTS